MDKDERLKLTSDVRSGMYVHVFSPKLQLKSSIGKKAATDVEALHISFKSFREKSNLPQIMNPNLF